MYVAIIGTFSNVFNMILHKVKSTTHLFQGEDVIVEIILQLFICIVDAELLKAVGFEVLKAKNVQDANRQTLETINTELSVVKKMKSYNIDQLNGDNISSIL